jgi:hypothetical protein
MAKATQSYHSLILNTVVPLLLCATIGVTLTAALVALWAD